MKKNRPAIAYITQEYPTLTTTFIYREVLALARKGFEIVTFAIWRPKKAKLSPESRDLVDQTHYVFPVQRWPFFKAHLHFLFQRPIKYLHTLGFVLTRSGESWSNRKRTLGHFLEAVYLAQEMQRRQISHIHAHFTINAASIALVVSRLLGISFSFTAHNIFFTDRLLIADKLREARFISAISEFTRQYLIDLLPGESIEDKIHIVHCGLSLDAFVPPPNKSENSTPMMLFVAQLAERKGAPYLIEACRILRDRGVPFRCVVVGGGPQYDEVVVKVKEDALTDVVQLTGPLFQDALKPYLAQADIFVLPCITARDGDMDGVPVSLMEAMAMEIATVSTRVSGIPELILDGETGLLVEEKDAVALADALQTLIENPEQRVTLGKKGRQHIVDNFNVDTNAAHLAALFERYLDHGA